MLPPEREIQGGGEGFIFSVFESSGEALAPPRIFF